MERDFAGDARAGDLPVQGGEGGDELHWDGVGSMLGVAGRPFEPAGLGVQGRAAGEPGGGPGERDRRAVGLGESARDAAGKLQAVALAFAQGLRGDGEQDGLRSALFDDEGKRSGDLRLAVADDDRDVLVNTGLVVARRPGEKSRAGVEDGAGREIADREGQAVAVGVGGEDRQREALAFGEGDLSQIGDHREVVAARDGEREALDRHSAAVVGDAHDDLGLGGGVGVRRPGQDGALDVAFAFSLFIRIRFRLSGGERHPRRGLHELPVEARPVGIQGFESGAPGFPDRRRWQSVRFKIGVL